MPSLRARMSINAAKFLGVMGLALFLSAGTLRYWQAWLLIGLHFAWLRIAGEYFVRRDPALVERRMIQDEQGEKEPLQRWVIGTLRLLGLVGLVVAGLDHRFGWSHLPPSTVVAGIVLFVAGCAVVFAVFQANSHTSSIIEVADGQPVVSTGPYGLLRHPFYAGTMLMGIATPLLLGSAWFALLLPPGWALLVVRILAEEKVLAERLPGYGDYMRATRSRLVPYVW
jgi:protein-S-isoprenylcysteine O-methyltransferase Ste14